MIRSVYLLAEGLVHLGEQCELPQCHTAQGKKERDLSHRLIHGDKIVPKQPELIEEDGWVVLHVGDIKRHMLCNL